VLKFNGAGQLSNRQIGKLVWVKSLCWGHFNTWRFFLWTGWPQKIISFFFSRLNVRVVEKSCKYTASGFVVIIHDVLTVLSVFFCCYMDNWTSGQWARVVAAAFEY
jgi:hypothetical protein